jgi:hypothetical protein
VELQGFSAKQHLRDRVANFAGMRGKDNRRRVRPALWPKTFYVRGNFAEALQVYAARASACGV